MTYRPPYGTLDFLFAGPQRSRKMSKANDSYRRGWHSARGSRDAKRR